MMGSRSCLVFRVAALPSALAPGALLIAGHQRLISPLLTRDQETEGSYGSICSIYSVRFAVSGMAVALVTRNHGPSAAGTPHEILDGAGKYPPSCLAPRQGPRARQRRPGGLNADPLPRTSSAAPRASCCYQMARRAGSGPNFVVAVHVAESRLYLIRRRQGRFSVGMTRASAKLRPCLAAVDG